MNAILPYLTAIWHFICAHEIVWWIIGFAIINLLLRVRTVESWLALCDKVPRLASLIRLLRAIGYDPGPVDGIAGPRTRAAIVAFQRAHGLVGDGVVGPLTRTALQLELDAMG